MSCQRSQKHLASPFLKSSRNMFACREECSKKLSLLSLISKRRRSLTLLCHSDPTLLLPKRAADASCFQQISVSRGDKKQKYVNMSPCHPLVERSLAGMIGRFEEPPIVHSLSLTSLLTERKLAGLSFESPMVMDGLDKPSLRLFSLTATHTPPNGLPGSSPHWIIRQLLSL